MDETPSIAWVNLEYDVIDPCTHLFIDEAVAYKGLYHFIKYKMPENTATYRFYVKGKGYETLQEAIDAWHARKAKRKTRKRLSC